MAKGNNQSNRKRNWRSSDQGCNRGRGRNNNRKPTRANDKSEEMLASKSTNNPAWYAADEALLRDAASYPFSWPVGMPIPTGSAFKSAYSGFDLNDSFCIPGIMAIQLTPTIGASYMKTSAANVAATSMYSFVRHANSGHSNYDSPDLMIYCLAMSQVYSYINYCQRLYGMASLYHAKNRYLPSGLFTAQNVDFDDFIANLANFRYWLNLFIDKASSLAVPSTMSYFTREAFIYSQVYCEGPSVKDQMYMYVPSGFYKFKLNTDSSGMLEFVNINNVPSGKLTAKYLMQYGEDMLQRILNQEDFGIMSGDILKAYGDNIIKLVSVPELAPIVPVYDPMVLTQMKNATIIPFGAISGLDITQTEGIITHCPIINRTSNKWLTDVLEQQKILTIDMDTPGPGEVIEATRLMACPGGYDTASNPYVESGAEIATGAYMLYVAPNGKWSGYNTNSYEIFHGDLKISTITTFLSSVGIRSSFKYVPSCTVYYDATASEETKVMSRIYDVDNFVTLSTNDIHKLHETAIINMLAVPSVAKVTQV